MPLFSGNVWKVCAQLTVMCRRNPVRPLEPAPKMTLIGKAQRCRHSDGLFPSRQELTCFCQPQLDKPGMRCHMEFSLETTGEGKAVCPCLPCQIGKADIVAHMRMHIVPRSMRHCTTLYL